MNSKVAGTGDSVPEWIWRDWGISRNTFVTSVGVPSETRNGTSGTPVGKIILVAISSVSHSKGHKVELSSAS
jgi:hypothetical protein